MQGVPDPPPVPDDELDAVDELDVLPPVLDVLPPALDVLPPALDVPVVVAPPAPPADEVDEVDVVEEVDVVPLPVEEVVLAPPPCPLVVAPVDGSPAGRSWKLSPPEQPSAIITAATESAAIADNV